ncbi:MAG: ABC transporter ATP-binding protein [Desulfamplus sp.]|nr:ABC transporter ATP-binding protein [Desulfamplus sp.]
MIKIKSIWKRFPGQNDDNAALKDVSLEIKKGTSVAIVGRSGSGKSTLINIMTALIRPTKGEYIFNDKYNIHTTKINDRQTVCLRRETGYISQASDLLNNFNVLKNIRMAAECRGMTLSNEKIMEWLKKVRLEDKAKQLPGELSGGEKQRVNIVRALACDPLAVFADEPTGALDVFTAEGIIDILMELSTKTTLVLVTHNPEAAERCNRQLCFRRGKLEHDRKQLTKEDIIEFMKEKNI